MMLKFFILPLLLLQTARRCESVSAPWKPIASPSTYIIHQSHPSVGSVSHTSNSISSGLLDSMRTVGLPSDRWLEHTNSVRLPSERQIAVFENNLHILDDDGTTGLTSGHGIHHSIGHSGGDGGVDDDSDEDYHGFKSGDGRILTGLGEPVYGEEDACSVDKYAFDHEGIVQYHNKIPKLDQFTICFWMRFTNHSGDHTLLTYSVDGMPREIQLWIANAKGSSYISMAVHGQQVFRLNYPLKMRKWHHACASWNGKTGEWQLWIKAERVGRGFHNRLVGYHIPGHGLLYTGGPSVTGHIAEGLHFEFTLLQMYKVALSAGKAHRDHKHHHVHHFNHEGVATTTTPAPRVRPSPQPMNPNLANGQIPTRVRINLANPPQQQPAVQGVPSQLIGGSLPFGGGPQGQQATLSTNFINGQFHTNSRLISQQLVGNVFPRTQQGPASFIQSQPLIQGSGASNGGSNPQAQSAIQFPTAPTASLNQSPAQQAAVAALFLDGNAGTSQQSTAQRFVFRRDSKRAERLMAAKRDTKAKSKRELVMLNDGSVVDDSLLEHGYEFQGLARFGQTAFKQNLETKMNLEDEIKEHDKEPAEEEVKAVMQICTSCDSEPFKGAVVLAWSDAKTTQDNTLKGRSVGGCGYF